MKRHIAGFIAVVLCVQEACCAEHRPAKGINHDQGRTNDLQNILERIDVDYGKWLVNRNDIPRLLRAKANPNLLTNRGLSPLHYSILHADLYVSQSLLNAKADANAQDQQLTRPLSYAKYRELTQLLLDHGAALNHVKKNGTNVVHVAVSNPAFTPEYLAFLCKKGAHVTQEDGNGNTPLYELFNVHHEKAKHTQGDIIKKAFVLLRRGASLHQVNKRGITPLDSLRETYPQLVKEIEAFPRTLSSAQAWMQESKAVLSSIFIVSESAIPALITEYLGPEILDQLPEHMQDRSLLEPEKPGSNCVLE